MQKRATIIELLTMRWLFNCCAQLHALSLLFTGFKGNSTCDELQIYNFPGIIFYYRWVQLYTTAVPTF